MSEQTNFQKLTPEDVGNLVPTLLVFLLLFKLVAGVLAVHGKPKKPELEAADLAARIKPVGEVKIVEVAAVAAADAAAAAAPAPAVAAAAPAAPAAPVVAVSGKAVYDGTCVACHSTGVAGAPKVGDKAAWAPRVNSGMDHLYASALKGKGGMPAKGGRAELSEAEVKAAVDYLVSKSK